MDFVIGGLAACIATCVCNPFEVVRTRQQLQGEMHLVPNPQYATVLRAMRSIVRSDGWLGLQRGLSVSLAYTFLNNSWRMGLFQLVDRRGWTRSSRTGERSALLCAQWSLLGGVAGLSVAMPLLVIRTQLQAQSMEPGIGRPSEYRNGRAALRSEFRQFGVRGLWRGYSAAVPRACVSSVVQLTVFAQLMNWPIGGESARVASMRSGAITGMLLAVALTPFDVVNTRMFTQPLDDHGKGRLYANGWQCVLRTVRREGGLALYRGFGANVLAMVPHTLLQMVLWEEMKRHMEAASGGGPGVDADARAVDGTEGTD